MFMLLGSTEKVSEVETTFIKVTLHGSWIMQERSAYFEEAASEVSDWLSECAGQSVQHYCKVIFA